MRLDRLLEKAVELLPSNLEEAEVFSIEPLRLLVGTDIELRVLRVLRVERVMLSFKLLMLVKAVAHVESSAYNEHLV